MRGHSMGLAQFLVTQTVIDVVIGKNDVKKSAPNLLLISRISARNSKMATRPIYTLH